MLRSRKNQVIHCTTNWPWTPVSWSSHRPRNLMAWEKDNQEELPILEAFCCLGNSYPWFRGQETWQLYHRQLWWACLEMTSCKQSRRWIYRFLGTRRYSKTMVSPCRWSLKQIREAFLYQVDREVCRGFLWPNLKQFAQEFSRYHLKRLWVGETKWYQQ